MSTSPLFDHGVDAIPSGSAGTIFDHIVEVKVAGIPGKQIATGTRGVATSNIVDNAVTEAKLNTSVAGDGLTGGGGSALAVEQDTTANSDDGEAVIAASTGLSIDGDLVSVDESFTNITPDTGGLGVDVKDLAAILLGIDNLLAVAGSTPTSLNKDMTASVTSLDEDQATATTVAATPFNDSYVGVAINGTNFTVGDGVKTTDCYFSGDGGTNARSIADVVSGDTLHWVGSVAGFELDASDRVDFYYDV